MRKEDFVYNDFLLIRKMKQGDDNAFDLFVHKYYQEILSYCYHHCFDQTYAEDFTQETFIRFFSKLPDYHYKGKTLNYLYTIAGNLCKDYLKKTKEMLLEEIELVEENQTEQILNGVYGLLGVNGAGKTTLMRMLCTLLKPTSGTICCNGKDIFSMDSEYRKLLGYLPQDFGFYPEFTVEDYLLYIAALKGIRPVVVKKRVKELIAKVGLSKVAHKKMKKLSGGMKRRAGIAQAMLNNPKILILDEPTAGLDPNERIRFRNLISELSEDRLVLLSTHIVSDIEYIANEIWLMKDGEILHKGSIDELINSMTETVWECLVPKNRVSDFMEKYKISNMKSEINQVMLRIISHEKPVENAMRVEASLEDVFLYYFGEKAGDENAAL